jgi:hypothetical protein
MSHPAIDQIIKTMAVRDPEQFARLLFPNAKFRIVSVKLDKELRIRTRVVDQIFKLRLGKQKYLLHFEFLTRFKARVAKKEYLGFLPLLLDISPKPDLTLLKKQRELMTLLETEPELFEEILGLCAILAKRYFARKILDQVYRENTTMLTKQMVKKFPGLKEPVQEIEKEAREEGREEGAYLAFQQILLDLIEARLGTLDKKTLAAIRSIQDIKSLRSLFKKALRLQSSEALHNLIVSISKKNGRHNGRKKNS